MNKSRVEAFTDAVLAIILTIMILEFKTPESFELKAITLQIPYLISYAVGYLFIGVAWYNHHYMFSKTKLVTKRIYWANNFWMFSTSFLPVATSWIGEDLNAQGPQIFYAIIYTIWSASYILLSYLIAKDNDEQGYKNVAKSIRQMKIYRYLTNWKYLLIQTIVLIIILIYLPVLQIVLVLWQIIFIGSRTNPDSDKLF
ncbi:TMEM175 family protein [Companilactobacillus allii]|uniref:DUF1211 domain-containing membrane protein n=1 Tax=Companilactobacillus allii TaxID=1847728 RepID=A0A1P8Q5X2_9LACO|nr:TMEM175 family protein [Companilactobacillus allii]APX73247.1 hypothetical protein BTM29_12125 [Companilactobacillus allii]USQ68060.1 TMEM175 family protein [Companilactobacillus allii]